MKKPTKSSIFWPTKDWLKPSPTTIGGGAPPASWAGLLLLEDSWHPLWAILVGTGLCFLEIPRCSPE